MSKTWLSRDGNLSQHLQIQQTVDKWWNKEESGVQIKESMNIFTW